MADRESERLKHAAGVSPSDFAGLGLQFVLAILLFLFAGKWVDARLGTEPVFLIVGTFVGAAAGFYSMYRKVTDATRRDNARRETAARDAADREENGR